ncbi:MAG: response regulator [Planctomycetia bacterium]|nr:response regulator [Planctomycetia bacterium]
MSSDPVSGLVVAAALLFAPAGTELHTARAVRSLSPVEAQAGRSVELRGVVTLSQPPHRTFYLQDHTTGVLIDWPTADQKLEPGEFVEVSGVTISGNFLPEVRAKQVRRLGRVPMPTPEPFDLTTANSLYLDGQWVTVMAVVQRAWVYDRVLKLDLSRGQGDAAACLPEPFPAEVARAHKLSGAVVRVRGVCRVTARGGKAIGPPTLLVSHVDEFEVWEPPADVFGLPATNFRDLSLARPHPIASRLPVRMTGVVTLNYGKQIYVQDDTGLVQASFINPVKVKPGHRVEVIGFPRLPTDPYARLDNAQVRITGESPLPNPVPGTVADAAAGKLDGRVVKFTGLVHAVGRERDWPTATIVTDKQSFTAILLDPALVVEPGSIVSVVGVVTKQPLEGFRPHTFAVMTPVGGLTVEEPAPRPADPLPPSWWTGRRVAYLTGAFLGICLLGVAAVTALRVQVRRATTLVRKQYEEKEKLEGQLKLAAKLEAVGRLAGGIAHDFNNLLTVINGCAQLLHEEIATNPHHAAELADSIRQAGTQAAALTGQLLTFSRQRVIKPHPIDLNSVVVDAANVLTRLMGERIAVRVSTEPNLPPVLADAGLIAQILLNLAVNARDAMPEGGTFMLSTAREEADWVRLTAADNGAGMSDEVKARVFEPFFTTKEVGKGTGLGLSTVYGIVQTLGGKIRFRSELGRGTAFEVDLPLASAQSVPPAPLTPVRLPVLARLTDEATTDTPPESQAVVMLVEDDDAVRALAQRVLEMSGLTVLTATGAEEALQLLTAYSGGLDLLVTDVVMPEMGGRELAERVRAIRPAVKVLFISGYTSDEILRQGVREDQVDFLHKPFSPRDLAEHAWHLLRGGSPDPTPRG